MTNSHNPGRYLKSNGLKMAVSQKKRERPPIKEITQTRRERERQERRESIVNSAKELFYDKGFQMTTMEDIAAAAELSKGTLYLYFRSKDELYVTVIIEGFQIIDGLLAEIQARDMDLIAKGKAMLMAFIGFCMENREYFRITQYFLSEGARRNLPEELVTGVSVATSKLLEYVAALVREGKKAGLLRKDVDPLVFSVVAWRTATGLLDLAVIDDQTGAAAGDYQKLFEDAFDLLISGALRK
jgi:TetR/AcrR family transcriptional regulator